MSFLDPGSPTRFVVVAAIVIVGFVGTLGFSLATAVTLWQRVRFIRAYKENANEDPEINKLIRETRAIESSYSFQKATATAFVAAILGVLTAAIFLLGYLPSRSSISQTVGLITSSLALISLVGNAALLFFENVRLRARRNRLKGDGATHQSPRHDGMN